MRYGRNKIIFNFQFCRTYMCCMLLLTMWCISFNALTVQCPDYYYYFIHLFKSSKIKFNQSSKRSDMTEDRLLRWEISSSFFARVIQQTINKFSFLFSGVNQSAIYDIYRGMRCRYHRPLRLNILETPATRLTNRLPTPSSRPRPRNRIQSTCLRLHTSISTGISLVECTKTVREPDIAPIPTITLIPDLVATLKWSSALTVVFTHAKIFRIIYVKKYWWRNEQTNFDYCSPTFRDGAMTT